MVEVTLKVDVGGEVFSEVEGASGVVTVEVLQLMVDKVAERARRRIVDPVPVDPA